MKIAIVTGASGFIGRHLCELLSENDVKTYIILRSKDSYKDELRRLSNCIPVYCDLSEIDMLSSLIKEAKIDVLYHLAWGGISGVSRGDYNLQIKNIEYTMKVIEAVSVLNCDRFVGVGTTAEYDAYNACHEDGISPNLVSLYGTAKISAHFMSKVFCNSIGMQHVWMYLGNTYGRNDEGNNFINYATKLILSEEEAKFTSGEQYYDFVYVSDVAQGLYCAGEKGRDKRSYYIGSGKPRKLREYIIELRNLINPEKELMLGAIPFNGISSKLSDFDIGKIQSDTGFIPKVSFSDGIKDTVAWIKEAI